MPSQFKLVWLLGLVNQSSFRSVSSGGVTLIHLKKFHVKILLPLLIREKKSLKTECQLRKKIKILFVHGFSGRKPEVRPPPTCSIQREIKLSETCYNLAGLCLWLWCQCSKMIRADLSYKYRKGHLIGPNFYQ